jgi:hypothetical protein
MSGKARAVVILALSAAAIRLIPLALLHPLQWDEIEYFRATDWVRQGLVPYRDFWEHHTPLQWFVFAPFTALTSSPGVDAVVLMRWMQVPLWIATFAMLNAWMKREGLSELARWSAMALALASSMFMTPAIEYRVDTLGCALFIGGLLLAQRGRFFAAGVAFCLCGFANLRMGPLLALAALLSWRHAVRLGAGVLAALLGALAYFGATGSLDDLWRHAVVENYVGEAAAEGFRLAFLHRVAAPFGMGIIGGFRFDPAAFDVGGVAILILGAAGLVLALRRRQFAIALLQLANLAFLIRMKFVFHYHFEILVLLMVPLVAMLIDAMPRREVVIALVAVAWCVNLFASVFRGKEADRAYQDTIMREVHVRTRPGDRVFDGVGWALRREPAFRYWFLPELAQQLATRDFEGELPAAVIADHNLLQWLAARPALQRRIVTHYLPVWRSLWMPGLSARVSGRAEWIAPADGDYRVYASRGLASHPWFRRPLFVGSYFEADAKRLELRLGAPVMPPSLTINGAHDPVVRLRKGQHVVATTTEPLGVMLVPGNDTVLFRQPGPHVTIDGAAPRVTHWPW